MGCLLASMLGVVAAPAIESQLIDTPPSLIGVDLKNTFVVLGRPSWGETVQQLDGTTTVVHYWERVDWLGTRRTRRIAFNAKKAADEDSSDWEPFVVTPPWLNYISEALRMWTPPENPKIGHGDRSA